MAKKKNRKILPLVMALIVVVLGSILFVGAASGWFDSHKVKLDAEYYADGAEFMELTAGEYDALDLTAQAYDNYELTAYDYDFNGKNLLV